MISLGTTVFLAKHFDSIKKIVEPPPKMKNDDGEMVPDTQAHLEKIKKAADQIVSDEDGIKNAELSLKGVMEDLEWLVGKFIFLAPDEPALDVDVFVALINYLKSKHNLTDDGEMMLKNGIKAIIDIVAKKKGGKFRANAKAYKDQIDLGQTRLAESSHRRTMKRRQLRRLIESLLFENFDVGEEIQTKDMTKDMPYVRSQKTYAFHDPGPSIALTGNNTFHDGAMSAGLIYQALSYGLNVEGEDLAEAGITQDDLAEIIKLNKGYKACYGTGDSMEFKRADIDMLPKSVLPKALAVYKFSKKLSEENPDTSKELFSKEALVSLGKRLINGDQSSKINVGAMRRKNKEYKKMKSEEKSSQ